MLIMSKKIFLTICFVSFLFNLAIGLLKFEFRFYIVGIVNFALSYYLLTKNPFKFYGWIFIFIFSIIFFGLGINSFFVSNSGFIGIQLVLIYTISSIFAILLYIFKNKKSITITYVVLYVILSLNFRNINNYYFSKLHEYEIVGSKLPILKIEDIEGKVKNVNNCNKILIIDLWSNSCGYCIEAFPEFQKVYNYYKNDKEVEVFSVNVDDSKPNRMMGHKLVKKYGFKNFFASKEILKQLKFNTFPHYMIVSKDGKIKYFGSLNTSRVETYNNIYDLVQNEK